MAGDLPMLELEDHRKPEVGTEEEVLVREEEEAEQVVILRDTIRSYLKPIGCCW